MKIFLTGASGFVGGRLLPRLFDKSFRVRCLTRSLIKCRQDLQGAEVVEGDACDFRSLRSAMSGCDVAYYLVHSMDGRGNFADRDRHCAESFRRAAEEAGLKGIIYVSGLANPSEHGLSEHLASRIEVGEILRSGSVPCTEFRAAMVIGHGSLSFRMVQHLCRRLPLMICPKWLSTETQPIAARDLIDYLIDAIPMSRETPQVIEVGGRDRTNYMNILKEYCRQCGLRRLMVPVPLLSPKLSSYWLGLVTPETAAVGKAMIDGLRNPTIVRSQKARQLFDVEPLSMPEAISEAIKESHVNSNLAAMPLRRHSGYHSVFISL